MKKFLRNIILFVLPAWCVLTAVDYLYSKEAIKSNYHDIEAWYDLMNGDIDADIVVMGSSRAFVHISPLILDSIIGTSTYNLGFNGSPIDRQIRKYHLFRQYNRKPKLIIQNIDQGSAGYRTGYHLEQFYPYLWDKSIRDEFLSSEHFSFWDKYVPMYRYIHLFDLETFKVVLTSRERTLTKGYEGKEKHWDGTAFEKIDSIKFTPNDTTLMMFDEYLAKAKAEGIQVVLVYTPIYIGHTRKMVNLDEMHAVYQKYADKYDIPILDYTYMDICNDTAYFYNAMHLNKTGAEIFSDSLAHDIKKLGLLN